MAWLPITDGNIVGGALYRFYVVFALDGDPGFPPTNQDLVTSFLDTWWQIQQMSSPVPPDNLGAADVKTPYRQGWIVDAVAKKTFNLSPQYDNPATGVNYVVIGKSDGAAPGPTPPGPQPQPPGPSPKPPAASSGSGQLVGLLVIAAVATAGVWWAYKKGWVGPHAAARKYEVAA